MTQLRYLGNGPLSGAEGFTFSSVEKSERWESISKVISKEITQLRYQGVFSSPRDSSDEYSRQFWKSISHMRRLQTLHINDCGLCDSRAECLWTIKTLRHVILPDQFLGPSSKADLPNLQTLKTVRVRDEWIEEGWPQMPHIRVLRLVQFQPKYDESFRAFLTELDHLTSLHITVDWSHYQPSYEMMDMTAPSYNYMQSMYVQGKLNWPGMGSKALDICLFPKSLLKLQLVHSEIKEDPMPVLENLESLKRLTLVDAYCGKQLSCSAGRFPHLEYLELYGLEILEGWQVEKGGMPLVEEVFISLCGRLAAIPELQHMPKLDKFTLRYVRTDLPKKLQGEESYKIQHIPSVDIK